MISVFVDDSVYASVERVYRTMVAMYFPVLHLGRNGHLLYLIIFVVTAKIKKLIYLDSSIDITHLVKTV